MELRSSTRRYSGSGRISIDRVNASRNDLPDRGGGGAATFCTRSAAYQPGLGLLDDADDGFAEEGGDAQDGDREAARVDRHGIGRDQLVKQATLQPLVTNVPSDVGEECLNIFWSLGRLVVEQESMLPHVHHQHGIKAGHVACFMKRNPMI